MTALTTIAPPRAAGLSARTLDIVLCSAVVLAAAAIGWVAASATGGLIPAQNAMFDADTGRVLGNITGESENYYRFKVHPWQGWICIFYQQVLAGLPQAIGVPLLCVLIAAATTGLLYAVLRRLALGPWTAASHALLFSSSAGFVFWSSLPETHMAGGASTLVAVLLLSGDTRARWRPVVALAVSFSMVVTNVMVWLIEKIDFEALRSGYRAFVAANLAKLRSVMRQVGWGVLLVFAVWAPQWLFLQKRIGIPFNFLEERHFVEVGTRTSSLHVLGFLPPDVTGSLIAATAGVGVMIAALRLLPPRQWFMPLFVLFGVVLHAAYGSDSAFLFSPNYMPLFFVSLALVMAKTLPKWAPAALLPVAALLLLFNLQAWNSHLQLLDKAGQMTTFQAAVHYGS